MMKINSKIAAVATAAALGTLALSAGPAFAAVGHGSGNPWSLVTARPEFMISSVSGPIHFVVSPGQLPRGKAFYIVPAGQYSAAKAARIGKIVSGGYVTLRGGVVWHVFVGPRPHQAPVRKK